MHLCRKETVRSEATEMAAAAALRGPCSRDMYATLLLLHAAAAWCSMQSALPALFAPPGSRCATLLHLVGCTS
jgi:hypothetical protein